MTDSRSYIAAIGSSGALLGAIVLACAALAGIVSSDGFPQSSSAAGTSSIVVDSSSGTDALFSPADPALQAAVVADNGTSGASNGGASGSDPAAASNGRDGGSGDGNGGSSGSGTDPSTGGSTDSGDGAPDGGIGGTDNGGNDGGQQTPPEQTPPEQTPPTQPTPPTPTVPADSASGGPIGATVDTLDDNVGQATGIHLGLGNLTQGVTSPVDGIIGGLTGANGTSTPPPATTP